MQFVDGPVQISSVDPTRDIPNQRDVHLANGRKFKLLRKDPYGFVFIQWDKGAVPDSLSGAYSDFDRARQALTNYLDNETRTSIVDEPVPAVPPLQYKKAKVANG